MDRELYLPVAWTADRLRCRRAGIPDDRAFATKPALAQQMLARATTAGVTFAWVTGDCIYGEDRRLRQWLEDRTQAYILAVSGKDVVWIGPTQQAIKTLLADLPAQGWERISAGVGSKGPRWYDWRRFAVNDPPQGGWKEWSPASLRRS